jgi:uncharacterized protein (DUF4415 family)
MNKEKFLPEMTQEQRERTLSTLTDEEIDFSDIPALSEDFFKTASFVDRKPKTEPISIRIETEVLEWFKQNSHGKGYQTFINDVLRTFVHHQHKS